MVPKPTRAGTSLKKKVHQLHVPKLTVKKLITQNNDPCIKVMQAMLGCWASSGQQDPNCLGIEQQLRLCMDTKVSTPASTGCA
jgi:hypothetical protein